LFPTYPKQSKISVITFANTQLHMGCIELYCCKSNDHK